MKRVKNLYSRITYELVEKAAKKAVKGKKGNEASEFRQNLRKHIFDIFINFKLGVYFTAELIWRHLVKVNTNGKIRIISTTSLEWRVVMHVLLFLGRDRYLQHRADVSYNCLEGYGITANDKNKSLLHAVKHAIYDEDIWGFVLMDIKHCYQTTNCKILKIKQRKLYGDKRYTDLLARTCECNGELPIGTPQSPTDHHIMLLDFDHFVLEYLPVLEYARYADDMFFAVASRADAHEVVRRAQNFLYYDCRYEVKQNIKIIPVRVKCDICGYVVNKTKPDNKHHNKGYTRLRRSTANRLKRAVTEESRQSYIGLACKADAKRLITTHFGMEYKDAAQFMKITRRWDALDIDIKELLDKTFDIIDFEVRLPDKPDGKHYVRALVKFPSYDKQNKACFEIRRIRGCKEELALALLGLQQELEGRSLVLNKPYSEILKEVLPITGVSIEDNYGFVFKGTCENVRYNH